MSNVSAGAFKAVLGVFVAALAAAPASGVANGTVVPCGDRRFDAVGAFMTNWGNGPCGGSLSGTCTLIAADRIITARHCLDIGPSNPMPDPQSRTWRVRFRRSPSGEAANSLWIAGDACHGVYTERRVIAWIDAPPPNNADQVVGILDAPVQGIRPIGVELTDPPRAGREVILAGWGFDGACFQSGDWGTLKMARGMMPANFAVNDFLVFSPCALGNSSPCQLSCPAAGGPFILGNLYDSGAPVLIEVPSGDPHSRRPELRLIATVSSPNGGRRPSAFNNAWGLTPPTYVIPAATPVRDVVADFNIDGTVNFRDVVEFLHAFFRGSCLVQADQAGQAAGAQSIFEFLSAYFGSSPASAPGTLPLLNPPVGPGVVPITIPGLIPTTPPASPTDPATLSGSGVLDPWSSDTRP